MKFEDVKKVDAKESTQPLAVERERSIRQFLAESLPPTEERIREPMNPKCEVSVVLPAYSERSYILRPIASLAKQKGVSIDQLELIIVVNNPPSVPQRDQFATEYDYTRRVELYNQGIGDNQETLKLVRYINGEDVPITLTEEEKEIIAKVQKSGLRVFAIDKASNGKTLPEEEANVGGARNRGIAEAVERFHNQLGKNGIIVQSDAEIRFSESYIEDIITIFKERPELIGISGRVDSEGSPEDYVLFKKSFSYSEANELYTALVGHLFDEEETDEKLIPVGANIPSFDGSNMASRAFEAAVVGGVPKLPGGEDPGFGFRLAEIGKTEKVDSPKTTTLKRFSPRTTTGRGQIHIQVTEDIKREGDFLVKSIEEIENLKKLRSELIEAIDAHETTIEHLRKIFSVRNQPLLSEEQLRIINQKIEDLQGMKGNEMVLALAVGGDKEIVGLFKSITNRTTEILGSVPLKDAVAKLIGIFCTNTLLKARYESFREQMIKEEDGLMRRRRKLLQSLLNILFKNKPPTPNNAMLIDIVKSHKEEIGVSDEDIKSLEDQGAILNIISEAISNSETMQQAMDAIIQKLEDSFSFPAENPLQLQMIELTAMLDAIEELGVENKSDDQVYLEARHEHFIRPIKS